MCEVAQCEVSAPHTKECLVFGVVSYICFVYNLNENLLINSDTEERLLFRGQADKEYELLPAIGRKNVDDKGTIHMDLLEKEKNTIEIAKYTCPHLFSNSLSPIDLLALMQHYELPTRLLDVSANPLVALYFACKSRPEKDGEVIVFQSSDADIENYPIINAIADSSYFIKTAITLKDFFENVMHQDYVSKQKGPNRIADKSPEEAERYIKNVCNTLLFVRASILIERQYAQAGQYILFPNAIVENGAKFDTEINPIRKNHKNIVRRFIIPRECKSRILKELSMLNIGEESLFRDSIDKVCRELAQRIKKGATI